MKNKITQLLIILLMISFGACNDLEDLNENPNNPTNVPVDRLFMGVQRDLSDDYVTNSFDLTTKFMMYNEWPTKLWDYHLNERRSGEDWWGTHFSEIKNIEYVLENAGIGYEDHRGVALVMKSWMYYIMTNFYGDIPYSEAAMAKEGINKPKYDGQQAVFTGILANLDEANTLLGTGSVPLNGDFLLGNNALKWKKFANSLKVRVLMAQANQVDPSSELQKMISDPTMYPLMESNADQPFFAYNSEENYPRNIQGAFFVTGTYMCETFIDTLIAYEDDRVKIFAGKVANPNLDPYIGVPSGYPNDPAVDNVSGISPLVLNSRENHALQSVWMHFSEVQFLLAEAAERGWISGGTDMAKVYYEEGIKASYTYQRERSEEGIAQGAEIDQMSEWKNSYWAHPKVAYEGSSTQKLQKITIQKWIALYSDMESYFAWKRTALPELQFNPNGPNGGQNPLRFRYPLNEELYNKDNYEAAIATQGADEWSTKMWILQ